MENSVDIVCQTFNQAQAATALKAEEERRVEEARLESIREAFKAEAKAQAEATFVEERRLWEVERHRLRALAGLETEERN
ncbi:hypothetical protein PAXINDRAFT_16658 [Paxillus involutus ATCC 200175]|uniref:Uncharacterized protein n=1 Tax=Paxillus involutus ATCC 200175 TaxID=664439 RepID=A0A0C9SRB8_PAXIN|nr:hypothetical protein PAXINDRAFT_16658 [Paxillus involutus ATCC 200175]